MATKNFAILIGGPGLFVDCDPKHDKNWVNYFKPMELAAKDGLYSKGVDEQVHWLVFEPPYETRWTDDEEITTTEKIERFFQDAELHDVRKGHADAVKSLGGTNYLDYIKQMAIKYGITYHGLRTPADFWRELGKFPDGSITRVWYSGHASPAGLFLSLAHDRNCGAIAGAILGIGEIAKSGAALSAKFDKATAQASKFYGCGTKDFAEKWHLSFGVPTAGATYSITFAVLGKPGSDVFKLIESTPTAQGNPDWQTFP